MSVNLRSIKNPIVQKFLKLKLTWPCVCDGCLGQMMICAKIRVQISPTRARLAFYCILCLPQEYLS